MDFTTSRRNFLYRNLTGVGGVALMELIGRDLLGARGHLAHRQEGTAGDEIGARCREYRGHRQSNAEYRS